MIEAIIAGALVVVFITVYLREKYGKEAKGKILCFFQLHKWEDDKPDAKCVRCGIKRNWREEFMRFHQIAGF